MRIEGHHEVKAEEREDQGVDEEECRCQDREDAPAPTLRASDLTPHARVRCRAPPCALATPEALAFQEVVQEFVAYEKNDISSFLDWWN